MAKLYTTTKRGGAIGTTLRPHRYADGNYVVSLTRLRKDYQRVARESELAAWVEWGYSVRMSNPAVNSHKSPSLICPSSICVLLE